MPAFYSRHIYKAMSGLQQPMVSIIIPAYNRADIIAETLQSVMQQTYNNWECLVVDDQSTDNTAQVINEFCIKDSRFVYLPNQRKKGAQGARNTGLQNSKGDYLLFFDSDDIMKINCLQRRVEVTIKHPGFDLYCFPTGVFKKVLYDSNLVWNYLHKPEADLVRFLQGDLPWCCHGGFWPKPIQEKLKGWDEDLLCGQDWDMHVRALLLPGLQYFKVSDIAENIDTYYRDDVDRNSIARKDNHPLHITNKWLLMQKTIVAIRQQRQGGAIKTEMSRLVYKLTMQSIPVLGFKISIDKFREALKMQGIHPFGNWMWSGYLYNIHHMPQNKGWRRFFNLAYRLFRNKDLRSYSSTHMAATLEHGTVNPKIQEVI